MIRHAKPLIICAIAISTLMASSASAATVRELLSRPGACFARTYDAAHLRSHPRQTVRFFSISTAGAEWRNVETGGGFVADVGVRFVGRRDTYRTAVVCNTSPRGGHCDVEGDGGSFEVSPSGTGLRIEVRRIQMEGSRDFSPDVGDGDNRVIILRPAPRSACRPS